MRDLGKRHWEKIRVALGTELVTDEEFQCWLDAYEAYEAGRKTQPDWPTIAPVAILECFSPELSFRAWAAEHSIQYNGIADLVERLGIFFGQEFFAFRGDNARVKAGDRLGETLVAMGAASPEQIAQALQFQKQVHDVTGVPLLLGIILVRFGHINVGDYYQALSLANGLDHTSICDELIDDLRKVWEARQRKA